VSCFELVIFVTYVCRQPCEENVHEYYTIPSPWWLILCWMSLWTIHYQLYRKQGHIHGEGRESVPSPRCWEIFLNCMLQWLY